MDGGGVRNGEDGWGNWGWGADGWKGMDRGAQGWMEGLRDAAASLPCASPSSPGEGAVCPSREGLVLGGGGWSPSLFIASGMMSMLL